MGATANSISGIVYATCKRFEPAKLKDFNPLECGRKNLLPQRYQRLEELCNNPKSGITMHEDILTLSVCSPPNADSTSKAFPVIVWVHGGNLLTGGGDDPKYTPSLLASKGAVVVKVSYRLGALGFLYLPYACIGNLGLSDIETALQWVHKNIGHFGGDCNNITLWGQSAGGLAVSALIRQGRSGWFNKAIIYSAPLNLYYNPKKAEKASRIFIQALSGLSGNKKVNTTYKSCNHQKDLLKSSNDTISLLKSCTVDEILNAQEVTLKRYHPIPFAPVLHNLGCGRDLDVMVGWNKDDLSPYVERYLQILGDRFPHCIKKALTRYITQKIISAPSKEFIKVLEQFGNRTQRLVYSWHPIGNRLGACHSIELPFLFGLENWMESKMMQSSVQEGYTEELTHQQEFLTDIWIKFVNGKVKD